jgi:hypothetical protein
MKCILPRKEENGFLLNNNNCKGVLVMKKIIALTLILGMASLASATVAGLKAYTGDYATGALVPVTGSVNPSDEIVVVLESDVAVDAFGLRSVLDSSPVTGVATAIVAANNPHPNLNQARTDGSAYVVNAGGVLFERTDGSAIGAFQFFGTAAPAGEALCGFLYHVPNVPASTEIVLSAGSTGGELSYFTPNLGQPITEIGSLVLHVIPEPMTMGLLAIGGLVALRRRRA